MKGLEAKLSEGLKIEASSGQISIIPKPELKGILVGFPYCSPQFKVASVEGPYNLPSFIRCFFPGRDFQVSS